MSALTLLNVHSNYSLQYGTMSIKELVLAAKKFGYKQIALTDINNVYGIHTFIDECNKAGIKPILGANISCSTGTMLLWVINKSGLANLFHLLSKRATCDNFDPLTEIAAHQQGLVMATASIDWLTALKTACVPHLYALLTNKRAEIITFARKNNLPLLAAPSCTLINTDDYELHQILRAIGLHTTVSRLSNTDCCSKEDILLSPKALQDKFSHIPEALENINRVADLCQQQSIFDGWVFPTPLGLNNQDAGYQLRKKVLEAIATRGITPVSSFRERLSYELDLIISKGFAPYFLVVADIVSHTKRTCGRGSGAASLVAYLLGITNVDPIKHNLYFDRFLNSEREDPPDIDIDFAWDERDDIIQNVIQKYGTSHCAMVSNHISYQGAAALREIARVMGITTEETNQICRIFSQEQRLTAAQEGENGYKQLYYYDLQLPDTLPPAWQEPGSPWPHILQLAKRLINFPRHLGVHVGGMVITPKPISNYAPIEMAPKGVPVVAWEKDGTETAGLIKMDLLSNRSLAVVRDAIDNLTMLGVNLDQYSWPPLSDPLTIDLLANGHTMGIFYVESPAMRQLQIKTGCGDFEHLVIHSSIIRPAANRFINEYVERLKGKSYQSITPVFDDLFAETFGIMCYQEDVSRTAQAIAGFSSSDADRLRKILTKKDRELRLPAYQEQFFQGASKNGYQQVVIQQIWDMMLSFDGYSFCKAHSASYAMLSFQSAFLKAHHPAPFMAAVISNNGGYYSRLAYISESHRLNITIKPPSINHSSYKFLALDDHTMQVGFMAIKQLGLPTARQIIAERHKHGPFRDLHDLVARVKLSDLEGQNLINSGALDELAPNYSRSQIQWLLAFAKMRINLPKQQDLDLDDDMDFPLALPKVPKTKKLSKHELLVNEYRALGFLCNQHPLRLFDHLITNNRFLPGCRLHHHLGQIVTVLGWPVSRKPVMTAAGQAMEFFSFEDETAIYETVLFPKAYAQFTTTLDYLQPYILTGRVEEDHGAIYLNIQTISLPSKQSPPPIDTPYDEVA